MVNNTQLNLSLSKARSLGGRGVPRFDPSLETDVRNTPSVKFNNLDAQIQALQVEADLAQQRKQISLGIFNQIQKAQKQAEKEKLERQERESEAQREFLSNASLNELGVTGSFTSTQNAIQASTSQILAEEDDPVIATQRVSAAIEGTLQNTDREEANAIAEISALSVAPELKEKKDNQREVAKQELQEQNAIFRQNAHVESLNRSRGNSSVERNAFAGAIKKFEIAVEGDPSLTPTERLVEKQEFRKNLQTKFAINSITESATPLSKALEIASGKSEFGQLPADVSQRALGLAQQITSAQEQIRSRAEERRAEARASRRNQALIAGYNEGPSEAALALAENLLVNSKNAKERREALKIKEYLETANEERFTKSDPKIISAIDQAILTNTGNNDEIRNLVNNNIGDGISVQDHRRILEDLNQRQEGLEGSNAFRTLMLEAEGVFPEAFNSQSGNSFASLVAALNGDSETLEEMNLKTPEEEKQSDLLRSAQVEIRQRIIDEEITSETELLKQGRQIFSQLEARIRNEPQEPVNTNDVRRFNIQRLSPPDKRNYRRALTRTPLVEKANNLYLNNPERFVEDVKNGTLSPAQAKIIGALLKPRLNNGR